MNELTAKDAKDAKAGRAYRGFTQICPGTKTSFPATRLHHEGRIFSSVNHLVLFPGLRKPAGKNCHSPLSPNRAYPPKPSVVQRAAGPESARRREERRESCAP